MALDALWAVLMPEVSGVSEVRASIHAALPASPAGFLEVSGVSGNDTGGTPDGMPPVGDTPAAPMKNEGYRSQPAWALGCTPDSSDTYEEINIEAANDRFLGQPLAGASIAPTRLFRQRGPWLTFREQSAAQAYHAHHFNCELCIAAGRDIRYGLRCAIGLALWSEYIEEISILEG